MFDYVKVDYKDRRLQYQEWQEIKAAETYGKGTQLPVLIDTNSGEIKNQSIAILKHLCSEFGVTPMKQDGEYEVEWYFETKADWETKPGAYDGLYNK